MRSIFAINQILNLHLYILYMYTLILSELQMLPFGNGDSKLPVTIIQTPQQLKLITKQALKSMLELSGKFQMPNQFTA